MENNELVKFALDARENAYSPYSKFRVGASLECDDGSVYKGCNIENSAYSPSCCAERVAIFKAVSEGKRNFKKIAIVSDSYDYTYPCGVCRQVMSEFVNKDFEIIVAKSNEEYKVEKFDEVLPHAFRL